MMQQARPAEGRVFIVGAGPGDPELLTIKAQRLILEAEVIYFDALVNDSVLADTTADLVFVGKRKGYQRASQDEINDMMLAAARQGKRIVRLKGGDPMIFGRGGEEAVFLRENGVECEVVPGVTAALAAAATAQIPLTHRGVSSSVAFCVGSPADHVRYPHTDTTVYYMGASTLTQILEEVRASGAPADIPVALIHAAGLEDEEVIVSTAGDLLRSNVQHESPLIIIVGESARFSPRWRDSGR